MDFDWSQHQKSLRDAAREFGETLNDGLQERETDRSVARERWRRCADFGVLGLPIPSEHGGGGSDALTVVGVFEALAQSCRDNGLLFALNAQLWSVQLPLLTFGSDEQKRRYLRGLCDGSLIGGGAMSEPDSGSDAFSLRTRADRTADGWRLNGSKTFVTNGPAADILVVYAREREDGQDAGISAFCVETDTPGLSRGEAIHKMGLAGAPMCEVFLEDCLVPPAGRVGGKGAGPAVFNDSMTWERACILAPAVGAMHRILRDTLSYVESRRQFGQPIGRFQMVQSRLVDMRLRLETSRALLYRAARKRADGEAAYLEAALAKLHISDCWVRSAADALELHGGYGYLTEYGIEREVRDAMGSRLYSGTSEIQRLLAAALLDLDL